MTFLKRRWQFLETQDGLSKEISDEFKISKQTAQILINRKLKEKEQIADFLNPRLGSLRDPFEIPGMQKAVARILSAKQKKEKIYVFGDYDVDGVTGTAIIVLALRKLGIDPSYYIPHRYDEGYGLNEEAIKKISQEKTSLIITVDCGISSIKEIDVANSLGIDVIITDHHNIPKDLPKAHAIVNPKLIKEKHPSKDLSGAGVAFKLIWALFRGSGISDSVPIKEFLDLAALGTVADIVPLVEENRILAVCGMKVLNEKKRIGVKHLFDAAGITKELNTKTISFMIAPRLNAPGRLKSASLSMELLLENDSSKAQTIAQEINRINIERQQIGNLIGEEVLQKIENASDKKLLLLSGKKWHPGVIGIVASRLVEKFNRPAILISEEEKFCRGSARGVEDFNIYEFLSSCRDLFIDFGGHKEAAGFEILPENIKILEERLSEKIEGALTKENLVPKTKIDIELACDDINMDLASELKILEPFGQANPNPIFMSKKLKIVNGKKVGSTGNHLKVKFSSGKAYIDSIGFGMGDFEKELDDINEVDVLYNLSVNEWNGNLSTQMELIDLKRVWQ